MEGPPDDPDVPATSRSGCSELFPESPTHVRLPVTTPRGNAFAQRAEREKHLPPEEQEKGSTSTRNSTLDLNAGLALPMPKIRSREGKQPATIEEEVVSSKRSSDNDKSKSAADPSSSTPHMSAMPRPLFSEKKSKIALLKSKFSIDNISKKAKMSFGKASPTTPVTPVETEGKSKFHASADTCTRMTSITADDNESQAPTLTNADDVPPVVEHNNASEKKPELGDVKMPVGRSADNPEGRFYREYEHLVVEEPRVHPHSAPLPNSPGSEESSHYSPHEDEKIEAIIMGDPSLSPTRFGTYARRHQVKYVTQNPRIPSSHGVIEYAGGASKADVKKPDGHQAEQRKSRQVSAEGESVYESIVSTRSSIDPSQAHAWEHMQAVHPDTMPEFASMHAPTPKQTAATKPEPVQETMAGHVWPFIVSSTPPKTATEQPSGTTSTARKASAPIPGTNVSQGTTIQQNACMFSRPTKHGRGGASEAGQAYTPAVPAPTPNFQPFAPPTHSVLQPLHHHLDEHGRNINYQIASTRDYMLDQVMRRLIVIEEDVGALRQQVLLQSAQVEDVRAHVGRVSADVVRGTEGVKATERRLVQHISQLRGIKGLMSEEVVDTPAATAAAQTPAYQGHQQMLSNIGKTAHVPKQGKDNNVNTAATPAVKPNPAQKNTSTVTAVSQSSVLEDVPTPTAAYRTPSTKDKLAEKGPGSVKQSGGEKKDDGDVFIDTPMKDGDDGEKKKKKKNVGGSSNAALRINTSIPPESATTTTVTKPVPMTTTGENKNTINTAATTTASSSNVSSVSGDVRNTPRRRNYWPRGLKTPQSRTPNPITGAAPVEPPVPSLPSSNVSSASSGTLIDQSMIHPAFRTNYNANSQAQQTPHREQEREHHRNWFQSANRSRPGSIAGSPRVATSGAGTPSRGGYQNQIPGNHHPGFNQVSNNNRADNHPYAGRGSRRGSGAGYQSPAVVGNNPYSYQQRWFRPDRMPSPPWNPPGFAYNMHNYPPVPMAMTMLPQPRYQTPPSLPNQQQGRAQSQQQTPAPTQPTTSAPPRSQPIGGGDGNASADSTTGEFPKISGPGEAQSISPWGKSWWYEEAYGERFH